MLIDFCSQIYITDLFSFFVFKSSKLLCFSNDFLLGCKTLEISASDEREIEKGSLILGVIPDKSQVILQVL